MKLYRWRAISRYLFYFWNSPEDWKHNKYIITLDCESGQFYWQIITCPANCSDSSYVCLVITVFQEQEQEEEEEWGGGEDV